MRPLSIISLLFLPTFLFAQDELRVHLYPGFNIISCNVRPPEGFFQGDPGPEVPLMLEQLRQPNGQHPVMMARDMAGRFYSPSRRFNNIPYWNLLQCYTVICSQAADLVWGGELLPADTTLSLSRGFNYLAYIPGYELEASAPDFPVLSQIIDNVTIAWDRYGNFMLPGFDFSNMEPWTAGHGYVVKVGNDLDFQYPAEGEDEPWRPLVGEHYERPAGSSDLMPVLINSIEGIEPVDLDQIAAYNLQGLFVGCGTVQDGRCGLAIWGAGDGFNGIGRNQPYLLRYWSEEHEAEYGMEITQVIEGGENFEPFRLCVLETNVIRNVGAIDQLIDLRRGWNLISLNVTPIDDYLNEDGEGYSVPAIFEQLRDPDGNHHIIRVVDGTGRFWIPAQNFNQISGWPLNEGLMVLTDTTATISVRGFPRQEDDPIQLREGWNTIAYLPDGELDASAPNFEVVSSVLEHVIAAKNGFGNFMLPTREYSNMPPWRPGFGYKIKVDEAVEFTYPIR